MLTKVKTSYLKNTLLILIIFFLILVGKDYIPSNVYKSIAVSNTTIAENIHTTCIQNGQKYGNKETCYSNQFKEIGKEKGVEVGFGVLTELQKIDRDAIGCHLISHGLGVGAYERDPSSWQLLVSTMPPICNYGGIHGVLEGYIGSLPEHSLSKKIIPTICGNTPRADCNHIVGHLILVETEGDLPKALDLCDVFSDYNQREFCQTGVFMEEETALNLVDHNLADQSYLNWPARLPELDKLCRTFTQEKFKACWTELVHVIAVKFNNNPKQVFDYCSRSPDIAAGASCKHHGIGIMAASVNFDLAKTKSWCDFPQANDSNFKSDCYRELAASTMSTIPNAGKVVADFCNSLDEQYKAPCLTQVNGYNKQNNFSND